MLVAQEGRCSKTYNKYQAHLKGNTDRSTCKKKFFYFDHFTTNTIMSNHAPYNYQQGKNRKRKLRGRPSICVNKLIGWICHQATPWWLYSRTEEGTGYLCSVSQVKWGTSLYRQAGKKVGPQLVEGGLYTTNRCIPKLGRKTPTVFGWSA